MSDFDALRFDIELAIKLDTFIPRSKRDRSQWAEQVSEKIAERLRQHWEFKHKPWHTLGPSARVGRS